MNARRSRRGLAVLVVSALALALGGCASIRANARQTFVPHTPGVLTVATTLPAPGFWNQDASGAFTGGFEYEIATQLADRFGLKLDVLDVPFDDIVHGRLGDADLALAQVSITDGRADDVDFSAPYYVTSAGVLAKDGTEITDLKTARERSWCVTTSTTEADLVDDTIEPTQPTLEEDDDEACAQAVAAGTVDAALVDVASALALQELHPDLQTVARFVTDERYGAVVVNGDDQLEYIDAGIRALADDGSLRDFADDWLHTSSDPNRIPVIVTKPT